MRAGLLVVGHIDPKSRHLAGDYPELFSDLLAPVGIEVVPYAADEGRLPDSLDECDGWICSPSRGSVYDDEPWIHDMEQVVRDAVSTERPFVGICFGHQLLARFLTDVVHPRLETSSHQVARRSAAHVAQADESDLHVVPLCVTAEVVRSDRTLVK